MENGRKEVNQNFYRKLLIVGIPMIIQQVIAVTLNLADTIMVGKVGENALAAVGAANQIYFIFGVVLFGVFSGAAVHAVQYWGIRDIVSLRKIIGIDYTVCLALAVPVTVFVFLTAPGLIRLFAEDAEVVLLGTKYLRIACFSYIFSGLTFVISYNSRAIQDVKVPTIINGCAILMNVICNYLLIYGKCGFPKLGVEGAAIATLLARVLECAAMYLSVYLRKEYPLKAKPGELFAYSGELFAGVMKTAVPVIITEVGGIGLLHFCGLRQNQRLRLRGVAGGGNGNGFLPDNLFWPRQRFGGSAGRGFGTRQKEADLRVQPQYSQGDLGAECDHDRGDPSAARADRGYL